MAALAQQPRVPTGPQLDNRRIAAAVIDLLVPLGLGVAVALAGLPMTAALSAVALGWGLFYCFATESAGGQTPGKKLMKLRVVSMEGRPATTRQIAIRTLTRAVEWNVIGLIAMVATGDRRQRLGDLAAKTVVTEADALDIFAAADAATAPASALRLAPTAAVAPPLLDVETVTPDPDPEPEPEAELLTPEPDESHRSGDKHHPEPDSDPGAEPEAAPAAPETVTLVKPIETVSAIEMLMQDAEPAAPAETHDPPPGPPDLAS